MTSLADTLGLDVETAADIAVSIGAAVAAAADHNHTGEQQVLTSLEGEHFTDPNRRRAGCITLAEIVATSIRPAAGGCPCGQPGCDQGRVELQFMRPSDHGPGFAKVGTDDVPAAYLAMGQIISALVVRDTAMAGALVLAVADDQVLDLQQALYPTAVAAAPASYQAFLAAQRTESDDQP